MIQTSVKKNYLDLKNELHSLIDEVDDPKVLYAVQDLLNKSASVDFWDELSDEVKESFKIGLKHPEIGRKLENTHYFNLF